MTSHSHVLLYHGPLLIHLLGVAIAMYFYYKLNVEKWWVDLGCWMIFKVQHVTIQAWIIFKKSEKSEKSFVFWTHDLHPPKNISCPKFQCMGQHEPQKKNLFLSIILVV